MRVKSETTAIHLDSFLPYLISLLAHQIARETSTIAKRYNLNLSHWRVLAAIADKPGRTANDVVAITPMDKGIVSRAVKSLIELDMVIRKASHEDGRISHLFLTPKGVRYYEKISTEVRKVDMLMTEGLTTQEITSFLRIIDKLSIALRS